jgi:hypothetical protein
MIFWPHRACRKIFPPLGLLVHRRFNLKLAVEIVLGRIDGDAPADFAVEVEPQEFSSSGGMLITLVAAELNPHFLAAQRPRA